MVRLVPPPPTSQQRLLALTAHLDTAFTAQLQVCESLDWARMELAALGPAGVEHRAVLMNVIKAAEHSQVGLLLFRQELHGHVESLGDDLADEEVTDA